MKRAQLMALLEGEQEMIIKSLEGEELGLKSFAGRLPYPNAPDKEGIMLFKYAVRVIPTSVFITRNSEIAHFYEGPLTQKQLISLIEHTRGME